MALNPESPCVNICVMDADSGLCVGCLRSIDEIVAWGGLASEARRALMKALPERKARLGAQALKRLEILNRARPNRL
ncbi:DUF1289 domain-containing protein [Neomegalonema perideroedes]|uniref:DUF1289 domain-containing protein n=1 Tax=Neomegalonema perideroedes TaxID=217219 RepID=UPI00036FC2E4|nr:DUF1289 domain-containing protein [Neomegalonema perideroedes]